jgi:hypothetical protein
LPTRGDGDDHTDVKKEEPMFGSDDPMAWRWATTPPQSVFEPAYVAFRAALESARPAAEAERAADQAFADYTAAVQQVWEAPDATRRVGEAYAEYMRHLQAAFADAAVRRRVRAAFDQYVGDLKRAWADLDPRAVTPQDLGAIAQSAAWVASLTAELGSQPGATS